MHQCAIVIPDTRFSVPADTEYQYDTYNTEY